MKKTLRKLAFSVMAIGSISLMSTATFAQGGVKPVYNHDDEDGNGRFIKGAHSTLSQGVVTDRAGRVWTISNTLGFYVVNPDGTEYRLTSGDLTYQTPASNSGITQDYVTAIFTEGANANESFTGAGRGIALAPDGNILITRGNVLYKLNSITGAPIARYQAPAANIAAPAVDANGNIFLSSVTQNKQYIVKQSTTNPSTFTVVMPETAFEGRARKSDAVVRSVGISKDGKTLYIPYANTNYIERYTSTDMVTWTKQADIENSMPSNAIMSGPNNVYWYITFGTPDGARPMLHFVDPNNAAFSWTEPFGAEVLSNDIRGLSFTKNYDTMYIASGDLTGNIHRFITTDPVLLSVRKDALAKSVNAYPVPTTGMVTLDLPESIRRNSTIFVTDLSGKTLTVEQASVSNGSSLDLTGLASGTYLVVVSTQDGNIVRRVVKQ